MTNLNNMLFIVANKHNGQMDKSGKPYILHVLQVMYNLHTEDEELMQIALGHDLVEDTDITYAYLREQGFSPRVIAGIERMTKVRGETQAEYMDRIMETKDSVLVKLADLEHNSDIRRLKGLTQKDYERMQKYHTMYLRLKERLKELS